MAVFFFVSIIPNNYIYRFCLVETSLPLTKPLQKRYILSRAEPQEIAIAVIVVTLPLAPVYFSMDSLYSDWANEGTFRVPSKQMDIQGDHVEEQNLSLS